MSKKKEILKKQLKMICQLSSDIIFYLSSFNLLVRIEQMLIEVIKEKKLNYKIQYCHISSKEVEVIKILSAKRKHLNKIQKNIFLNSNQSEEYNKLEGKKSQPMISKLLYPSNNAKS
jgi:hypothetical protein